MMIDQKYINIHSQLIEKCRLGDRRSQFELYKLYYKAMYNISLRIVKNRNDAEDIMQDAFISAFTNIESFSGKVSFGAWLKRIVINRAIDFLKQNNKIFLTFSDEIDLPDQDDTEWYYDINDVERVKKAIALLPEGYRVVTTLYLLEGYDHEEIGGILNISASASRSQFTRAKKKVVEIIENSKEYGKAKRIFC